MSESDVPVPVFSGPHTEALFLKSLLESAGIETTLPGSLLGGVQGTLYVRHHDAHKARDVIEDFLQHGKRSGVDAKPADVLKGGWPTHGSS